MQTSISRNKTLGQTDVYSSLLEGKRQQSLAKPGKIKFFNECKLTELAKHKHCVHNTHTKQHMCDLRHDSAMHHHSAPRHSQTALLYFFSKKRHFHRT